MKQLLIFTFIFFAITSNAQDEERFNFLSEQTCECIENLRKVNEKTQFRCQKKIFCKNKKRIKKLIEQGELKTDFDRISNHFRPLTLQVKAVEKVIDSRPKFRTSIIMSF